jgi:hypothetical protein
MARSDAIWVVLESNTIIGCFTVKHEMVKWLCTRGQRYNLSWDLVVRKYKDGKPHEHYMEFGPAQINSWVKEMK